jgi:hypothetical protein
MSHCRYHISVWKGGFPPQELLCLIRYHCNAFVYQIKERTEDELALSVCRVPA